MKLLTHFTAATLMTVVTMLLGFIFYAVANTYDHCFTVRPYLYELGGFWFLCSSIWMIMFLISAWNELTDEDNKTAKR